MLWTMTEPTFLPGLELCGAFYWEAVRPILDAAFPSLAHSAGILGTGSEVAGFDDVTSTDHHWGPRVMLFLSEDDLRREGERLHESLAQGLPPTFMVMLLDTAPPVGELPIALPVAPATLPPVRVALTVRVS